jgi:lycopene cyclase domain-containing protein
MTYWLINIPFFWWLPWCWVSRWGAGQSHGDSPWLISAVVMMALTAVFDNAIIGSGLVAYDPELLSGVMVGVAPLEDFAYTAAALMLIPALWHLLERRGPESS